MGGIFSAIDISAGGLTVQRKKMDTVAENIANADTVRTPEGGPYRRKRVVVSEDQARVEFRSEFNKARDVLRKTHSGHRDGINLTPIDGQELSHVEAETTVDPASGFRLVHDPGHPDADEKGYVRMPDIEVVTEMVDMIAASRAYEANIAAIGAAKQMLTDAMDI